MIYFMSGHLLVTSAEFEQHDHALIDAALANAGSFVVGDASTQSMNP